MRIYGLTEEARGNSDTVLTSLTRSGSSPSVLCIYPSAIKSSQLSQTKRVLRQDLS